MFQRLLVSTDFSDGLYRLAKFVPNLATNGFQQIVFLHCVPFWEDGGVPRVDDRKVQEATERLSIALQHPPTGVDIKVEVVSGRPADIIPEVIKQYQIDLTLLGMPSRSLLDEKLFGSTTVGLCQRATIPLMILRPQLISAYTGEELALRCQHLFRYLLIPYDGSDTANYLVAQIKQYAQNRAPESLELCLLCWVDQSGHREMWREDQVQQARAMLEPIQADLESLGLQVSAEVRLGNAVTEVLEVAQESDISAIAVSSRNLGKLWEISIPSFAGEILRRSWYPVIFIPPQ